MSYIAIGFTKCVYCIMSSTLRSIYYLYVIISTIELHIIVYLA